MTNKTPWGKNCKSRFSFSKNNNLTFDYKREKIGTNKLILMEGSQGKTLGMYSTPEESPFCLVDWTKCLNLQLSIKLDKPFHHSNNIWLCYTVKCAWGLPFQSNVINCLCCSLFHIISKVRTYTFVFTFVSFRIPFSPFLYIYGFAALSFTYLKFYWNWK